MLQADFEFSLYSFLQCTSVITVNVLKFRTLYSFSSHLKMVVIMAEINILLVRIANRVDPDQAVSSEAV